MSVTKNEKQDTKLLMWVAGTVVAGAAGIALLAGLAVQREADEPQAANARSGAAFQPAPPPIAPSRPDPTPAADVLLTSYDGVSETPPPVEAPDTVVFTVDPNENFLARALETYEAREFDHAVAYLEAEIAERPQRAWTHYILGLALWKSGSLDEAAAAMEESAKLGPDSIKTLVNLSRIRNDQGDFEGALEAARVGLDQDPQDASAQFLEGRSLFNLGRVDEAVSSLTASLAIDPDNGYVQNLYGLALMRQGHVDQAVLSLERASTLEPDLAYARNNLGMALELAGRTAEAVGAYRRGVEIDPGHDKVAANLARLEPTLGGRAEDPPSPGPNEVAAIGADEPLVADSSVGP